MPAISPGGWDNRGPGRQNFRENRGISIAIAPPIPLNAPSTGHKPHIDWSRGLFQFANRLAHQWFLKDRCGIDTRLVFLCFTNDSTHLPHSKDEFIGALKLAEALLGLGTSHAGRRYFHVFIDVNELS